jgi:hypothetical protein
MGSDPKRFETSEAEKVTTILISFHTKYSIMTSNGYWVNNEHIVFKNIIKPCRICRFCPYGQLVEDFPLPSPSRSEAIEHNNYMVSALVKGTFDKPDPKHPYLMTKDEAIAEIENFNPENYPDDPVITDKMACTVFGHHCPVYYHGELLSEDNKITQEELDAFDVEIAEYMNKLESNINKQKEN